MKRKLLSVLCLSMALVMPSIQADAKTDSAGGSVLTIESHAIEAQFPDADYTGLTAEGTYPQIIVSDDFTLAHPKFWACMDTINSNIKDGVVSDIGMWGYGTPTGDGDSYVYDNSLEVLRIDDSVFSYKYNYSFAWSNSEGAVESTYIQSYDVNTGSYLDATDFVSDPKEISKLVYQELKDEYPRVDSFKAKNDDGTYAIQTMIQDMATEGYLNCYVADDEFEVFFQPYALTSDGKAYQVELDIEDCIKYLNPAYTDDQTGKVNKKVKYTKVTDPAITNGQVYVSEDYQPEQTTVHVSTAKELAEAIAPDTRIVLEPGRYDITDYVVNPAKGFLDKHPYFGETGWGMYGIVNLSNLTIEGQDLDDRPEIVIRSAYDDVLGFNNCSSITLNNLVIGHEAEKGSCSANVLSFNNCNGISGSNLDLYGSGAYGVSASGTYNVHIDNSKIHDCTYGMIDLMNGCSNINFYNTQFVDNEQWTMIDVMFNEGGDVYFYKCTFKRNVGDFFSKDSGCSITFEDCVFGYDEREFLDDNFDQVNYYEEGAAG